MTGPVAALGGRLIVVTNRSQAAEAGHRLVDVVAAAVDAGAPAVLLREKDLPRAERIRLARAVSAVLDGSDAVLVVASDAALAAEVGAVGVQMAATEALRRPPADLMARSCHSVDDLRAARSEGLDYATFSPVWATDSKPGYGPALGTDGLAAGVAAVPDLPVYALGGVGPGRAAVCVETGAAGVAAMGAIMRAPDPAKVVRLLLEEMT